ncbi:MAG: tRNA uridine-5-carboxymethylaminomethyl(34) synthesis GTPase MnmE [Erysipelotrichaceae bacterium]|jgi:tRNA modification GTPase|nr:tRNA uridine-5-carboxymethylaminomethyl(34) synthesis GTPase MnmE [Erysipelotrichaceae bacterium]
MLNDTICAISTALKDGAISIVRMSGDGCFDIVKKISDVKDIRGNTIVYSHIYDEGEMIDEVLISFFEKGKSYTREDMAEINCHGGVYVTRLILNLLLKNGCRLAEPGEFTKRAYLNGRIDLSEADSINDMIRAESAIQARSAIRGISGSIERLITPLMDEMRDVISMIEVNIDYPEYEDERQMSNEVIKPYVKKWIDEAEEMVDKAERFRLVKDGLDTVIIGKPNVGKSSLLNALLEKDKAIVTDIAGTTRDLVEGKVNLKNITLNLIDTAGIRHTEEKIEKIGIEKTMEAIEEADLILLVVDAADIDEEDRELMERYKDRNLVVVYNKSDLKQMDGISISALNKEISSLTDYLNERYQDDISLVDEDVLNNERQIALMKTCLGQLKEMYENIDDNSLDMVVTDLDGAYHDLCQILGKEYQEDLIDHMFRNFCLGK